MTNPISAPASPRRRAVIASLVLGAAGLGLGAWQLPRRGSGPAAPVEIGDDVCVVAPPTPYDAASGRPLHAAREVPADARCPVCGMYPARSRAWAAQVIFADGDAFFFDSPLSLLMYLADVDHYTRGRTPDAIVARYVENDEPIESIVAAGFARADVERVTRLIKLNEYKRRQGAVGIRVTRRSFGKDWRYPITSKFRA